MNNLFSLLFYVNVGAPWGFKEATLQEVEEASYEVIKLQVKCWNVSLARMCWNQLRHGRVHPKMGMLGA
uniref:Uncharacterized protein n=1 Tax=Triticum urartu TaxID=4572 RepID=A0A8R7U4Y9_TRIUA